MRYDTMNAAAFLTWRLHFAETVRDIRDDGDLIQVHLTTGEEILIYMVERPLPLTDIHYHYRTNTAKNIFTLFIFQLALLLPDNNTLYLPDDWMSALLSVQGDKIYAFEAYGQQSLFFPVHFKRVDGTYQRRIRHGQVVDYATLHGTQVTSDQPLLCGTWHVADFGAGGQAYRAQKSSDKTPLAFYYAILGIADNADLATVKQAFRLLAKQYHPDINHSREAAFRMKEINDAYRRLRRYLEATE